MRVDVTDVARSSLASVDASGVQFERDGRLYRAFRPGDSEPIRRLLDSPGLDQLFDAGLVRFWPAAIEVDGHDVVVEVERVPVVTYPIEWPTRMLQAAAVAILRLSRALLDRRLRLKDAHPWNVLFDGVRPVFVDLGSICDGTSVPWQWLAELRRHVIVPLALHSMSLHRLGDAVMREHRTRGAKGAWDSRLLQAMFPPTLALRFLTRRRSPAALLDDLDRYVGGLDARGTRMLWSSYDQQPVDLDQREQFSPKMGAVDEFLRAQPPGRIVDLAANRGLYSRLAAAHGHHVVAIDVDDRALGELYDTALAHRLAISPVRMDLVWPTGSHGAGLSYADAFARLRGDAVLALAILHHLAAAGVRFELFAHLIDRFAARSAIVEFVPRHDAHVAAWPLAREPWYELDNLVSAMRPHFPRARILPSSPEPRVLIVFER